MLHDAFAIRGPSIDAEGKVSSQRAHLRPLLLHLLRTSRNSLGPLRSRRLRRCRSSSVADGSLRRSISWPAIARAFSALPVRTPARWALGPCSVAITAVTDLHYGYPIIFWTPCAAARDLAGRKSRPWDSLVQGMRLLLGRACPKNSN